MQLFTVFILSLFLTIALVPLFKRLAFRMHIVDDQNERKVHVVTMPKIGGISMLSFMLIGILAFNSGNMAVAVMSVAVIGGVAGFLRYNTHPAVLFMGDSGSQLLGFLLGVFAIAVTQRETPYSKALALPIIGFPMLVYQSEIVPGAGWVLPGSR